MNLISKFQNSNPEIFFQNPSFCIHRDETSSPPPPYTLIPSRFHSIFVNRLHTQNMIARRPYYFPSKHVSSLPFKREETGLKNETTKEENEKKEEGKKRRKKKRGRERERGSKRRWKVKPEITKGSCDVCSLIREF